MSKKEKLKKIDKKVNKKIPITDEIRFYLKSEREKLGISREILADEIGVLSSNIKDIESGKIKTILEEIYRKFMNFFDNGENYSKKIKKGRILLTDEIRVFLKSERRKIGISRKIIADEIGVLSSSIKDAEFGKVKTISKEFYRKITDFLNDKSNYEKYYTESRIEFTNEMRKLLKESKEKSRIPISVTSEKIGFSKRFIGTVDSEERETISKEIYNKLIDFYNDEENIKKYSKAARISLTNEIRELFKLERKKLGVTRKIIANELGILSSSIKEIESGKGKTISEEVYKKAIDFFDNIGKNPKDYTEGRIPITDEMYELLKSGRKKLGITAKHIFEKFDVSEATLLNIESKKTKTILEEVYNRLIDFYSDEKNIIKYSEYARISLTDKIRTLLKSEREKLGISREIVVKELGISAAIMKDVETGKAKTIPEEAYNKLIAFYSDEKNIIKYSEDVRISLTNEMCELLRYGRKKSRVTINFISEKFDIPQATLLNIESKETKTISKKLYNSLLEFYGDDRNNAKYYRKGILVITDKMCGLLRSERKKLGLTLKLVAERFEILPGMLLGIETKTTKSISEELYNKLLDFYANEKVYVKEVKEGRLILSDEMLELLRTGRKKLGMTVKSVSEKFDISKETLQRIESGNAKTISEEIYKRLVEIYNDEKNKPENVSAIRISLTDTMRKSLKSGREKFGMTTESVSKKFDISPMTLRTIESKKSKTISEELYNKLIDFYNDEKNIDEYSKDAKIPLKNETIEFFKSERKKLGVTHEVVSTKIGVLIHIIKNIESGKVNSISKELYNKLINFYSDEKNYFGEVKRGRLKLTDKIHEFLKLGREKLGMTAKSVSEKFDISKSMLMGIESRRVKTISEELCNKLMIFYGYEKNHVKRVKVVRLTLKDEMYELLRTGRKKSQLTAKSVSEKFDISTSLLRGIEYRSVKTISEELYNKLIDFYADEKNYGKKPITEKSFIKNSINEKKKGETSEEVKKKEVAVFPNDEKTNATLLGILKKNQLSLYDIGKKIGISHYNLYQIEAGLSPTIPAELYHLIMKMKKKAK